jgi:hypothetical protein
VTTDEILDQPDTFEQRLRTGLKHLAHSRAVSEPDGFNPDLLSVFSGDSPQPRRTAGRGVAAAAAVIAVVGGLAVLASRDASPASSNQPATSEGSVPPETVPTSDAAVVSADRLDAASGLPRFALSEPGWTMTHATESEHGGSYAFEHADGRSLDVNTIPGGEEGFAARIGDEERVVVGAWHVLDYAATNQDGRDVGRYRADSLRGEWTYEFDGMPFDSLDAFMTTVTGAHAVGATEWEQTLPEGFVSGSDQVATAVVLLRDVPLPDGFDIDSLNDGTTNSRYQFITRVSGAVTCAWLDQWFTGRETGDAALQQDAAAALATSRDWTMLTEIADQGGWSDEVWQHADAVNGGEGVLTGAGPQPPSREEANSALSCEI